MGLGLSGAYKLTGTTTLMGQYTLMDGDNDGAYLVGANYPVVDGSTLRLDAPRAWCWAWPMCSASCAARCPWAGCARATAWVTPT
jgi:hypothetical protein